RRLEHRAEKLSALPSVGVGDDDHPFASGRRLYLAGLYWPDETGLAGHSDGDAAAHAACDALLPASGLGDLGQVFGTSDPRWAGASGVALLEETARRVRAAGFRIGNVAIQVIGNRPKLAPRRTEAERTRSAAIDAPRCSSCPTAGGVGLPCCGAGLALQATALGADA